MTRIQRERFDDPALYDALKDSYILTADKMKLAKEDMCVMHPLPRVNEISVQVDSDPRACYFKQVLNGKYMRMALILKLLGPFPPPPWAGLSPHLLPRCVSRTDAALRLAEQELEPAFILTGPQDAPVYRCLYCEHRARQEK